MLLLFFVVWVIFNGTLTFEIACFGIAVSLLMFLFICKFMDYSIEKEKLLIRRSSYYLAYFLQLIGEILKANRDVFRLFLFKRKQLEPVIVSFRTSLRSEFSKTLLANSITLTPGTITVSLEGNELLVHCLDRSLAEGIESSVFVQMLEKIERIGEGS